MVNLKKLFTPVESISAWRTELSTSGWSEGANPPMYLPRSLLTGKRILSIPEMTVPCEQGFNGQIPGSTIIRTER